MARADTSTIAKAQTAFQRQAAVSFPPCGHGFVIAHDRISGDTIILPMRCHKWSCPYCATIRRTHLLSQIRRGHPERHIVLTIRPNPAWTLDRLCQWLRARFRLLVQAIRRKYGTFEYIAILELHKSGVPHLHVLARGSYIPQKWLSLRWQKLTGAWQVHIKAVTRTRRAANELAKYLAKTAVAFNDKGCTAPLQAISKNWLLDPEANKPDHAERDWIIYLCHVPLAAVAEAARQAGLQIDPCKGSPGMFTVPQQRPPPWDDMPESWLDLDEETQQVLSLLMTAAVSPAHFEEAVLSCEDFPA